MTKPFQNLLHSTTHSMPLRDLPSGQELRNYRKKIAAYASTPAKPGPLTMKFKLELPANEKIDAWCDFKRFESLYDTVEGTSAGSLSNFLFSLILSGFRIFGTSTEAQLFKDQRLLRTEDFQKEAVQIFGVDLPKLNPSSLLKRLATTPRARGGKDTSFTAENIEKELQKDLCPSLPKGANEENINRFFTNVSNEFLQLGSWNKINTDKKSSVNIINNELKSLGFSYQLPVLKEPDAEIKKASIVFDPSAVRTKEIQEEWLPYLAVATILAYPERDGSVDEENFVKDHLTTGQKAAGLSWLFNKGLLLFKHSSIEELMSLFDAPEDAQWCVERVKGLAEQITEQDVLFTKDKAIGYHEFRTSFGGHINSWITNYVKRLQELDELLTKLPKHLEVPKFEAISKDDSVISLYDISDCKKDETSEAVFLYNELYPQVKESLDNLRGSSLNSIERDVTNVRNFSEIVNRLNSIKHQIENSIEMGLKGEDSFWKKFKEQEESELLTWKELKDLPKLNKMSGGVPKPRIELEKALSLSKVLRDNREKHYQDIEAYIQKRGSNFDPLAPLITKFSKYQNKEQKEGEATTSTPLPELAIRCILQRIARLAQTRNDEAAIEIRNWFLRKKIFVNSKDANKYFHNQKGQIFVHPMAAKRHAPYLLNKQIINNPSTTINEILNLSESLSKKFKENSFETQTADLLWGIIHGFMLSSITFPIPSELALPRFPEGWDGETVSEDLRLQLKHDYVGANILGKVFNTYTTQLNGAGIRLRRDRFFLRTKFVWIGNCAIHYRPKKNTWKIPCRYFKNKYWQQIRDSGVLAFQPDNTTLIDSKKTFENVLLKNKIDSKSGLPNFLRILLRELPHDWCYALPVKSSKSEQSDKHEIVNVIRSDKGKLTFETLPSNAIARLIGPSSMKSRLDRLLIDPEETIGDATLLVDHEVNQKNEKDEIYLEGQGLTLSIALPMTSPADTKQDGFPFTRIIGIDQGEAGLGFAVFNLSDAGNPEAKPIKTGTIPIPSIRSLIRGVKKYRNRGQGIQKFNQQFDSTMFSLRENVAGDVCGAIAGLMKKFSAFPVLERQVSNLASGSKQLSAAYKMVNARFLADMIGAHNSERTSWWFGANSWMVPNLLEEVSEEFAKGKKKGEIYSIDHRFFRDAKIFPGAAVNAKWTSKICTTCNQNAYELLRKAEDAKITSFEVNDQGCVNLMGSVLQLYQRPSAEAQKEARRRNERAPWIQPIPKQTISLRSLKKAIAMNLRRPPRSLQSKDTSQSRYFCVFKDCSMHNREVHADLNAAINIGRRFLGELKKKEKN